MTARLAAQFAVLLGTAMLAMQAGDAEQALERWEARVKELRSFTCGFRQEKKVSFLRRPLVSSGTMAYRDRRLLWKTEEPSPGFLSVDEKEVRIYTPEFRTLEIVELGGASGGAGSGSGSALSGAFPGFTGDFKGLREQYVLELVPIDPDGSAPGDVRLRFTPRTDDLKQEVTSIEVVLDRDALVKSWRIVRANGDELSLTISDFVANAKVSDAQLTFEVPADAKVSRIGTSSAGGAASGSK